MGVEGEYPLYRSIELIPGLPVNRSSTEIYAKIEINVPNLSFSKIAV
jgi:hypothetical protein